MPDPVVTPAEPIVTPTPPVTPVAGEPPKTEPIVSAPISVIKPDMTFIEGWQDKLPEEIKTDEVEAELKDGILDVALPKCHVKFPTLHS